MFVIPCYVIYNDAFLTKKNYFGSLNEYQCDRLASGLLCHKDSIVLCGFSSLEQSHDRRAMGHSANFNLYPVTFHAAQEILSLNNDDVIFSTKFLVIFCDIFFVMIFLILCSFQLAPQNPSS